MKAWGMACRGWSQGDFIGRGNSTSPEVTQAISGRGSKQSELLLSNTKPNILAHR